MGLAFLIISTAVQAVATVQAVRLALRRRRGGWIFVAVAAALMLGRRLVSLYDACFQLHSIDPAAEFIGLLISLLLLIGLSLLLKWGAEFSRNLGDATTNQTGTLERLKRQAILLGAFALLGSSVLVYFGYANSKHAITERLGRGSLDLANMLDAAVASRATNRAAALIRLSDLWRGTQNQYPDSYLCVVGDTGKLMLNTRDPQRVGAFVGDTRIPNQVGPHTVLQLVQARHDWAGRNLSSGGIEQIAAYAYSTNLNALIAVHVPAAGVDAQIREAALPWAIGFATILVVMLPLSLGLLHHVGSASQETAFRALLRQQESDERYRLMVEGVKDYAICMLDAKGHVATWNTGAERLTGWSSEEILGRHFSQFYLPEDFAKHKPDLALKTAEEQGRFEIEDRRVRKDGSRYWANVIMTALRNKDGQLVGFVKITCDLTERKQAEAAIQERLKLEEQLSKLAAMAPGVIHAYRLRPDGSSCFPYASSSIEHIYGYKAEALVRDASPALELVHPDDRGRLRASVEESARQMSPWRHEFRVRHPRRGSIWVEGHSSPTREPDGSILWQGFLQDITERKLVEEALQESERKLRTVVQSAPAIIFILDRSGIFRLSEGQALAKIGLKPGEVVGKSALELYKDVPQIIDSIAQALSGRPTRSTVELPGVVFDAIYSPLFDHEDHPNGLIGLAIDITEKRRLEEQLRQAQKMEAIGTLAGGIAHDFNNIITAILGNAELIRMDVPNDHAFSESLSEIKKAGLRAKNLVQQILAFSRQQTPERRVISVKPVVEEAISLLRATLPHYVKMVKELEADAPNVLADPTQIHQAILNLCTNAWQALEGKPGCIEIKLENAILNANQARESADLSPGRYARICVSDTGKGIDADTLNRIFDPFFTTKPPGVGTGLGLSVVHGIMKDHQGAVTVASEPGKGTKFCLYFPASEDEVAPPETEATTPQRGCGEHVLYLDDEEPLVLLATRTLERLGYRVSGFVHAEEALKAFRENNGQFDVAIADLSMPGQSGLQVAAAMQAIRPNLPVILSSGHITDDLKVAAQRVGIKHLIYKPHTLEQLNETVRQALAECKKT